MATHLEVPSLAFARVNAPTEPNAPASSNVGRGTAQFITASQNTEFLRGRTLFPLPRHISTLRSKLMATWAAVLLTAIIAWLGYIALRLLANYRKALAFGLPIVVSPLSPEDPLWMAVQSVFSGIIQHLPLGATSFTRHCRSGWEFYDRYKTHERLGDAWVLVTPAWTWLIVANAEAVSDIFSRGKEFKRPVFMSEPLNVFGPNIGTAEGQDWQRQRRLTAPSLNESKMPAVWTESIRQAEDMLKLWASRGSDGFDTTEEDTRTLALHVLAYVAFQKSYPFSSFSERNMDPSESMSYRDSIAIILENAVLILVIPHFMLSWSFMPENLKRIGTALRSFRDYMTGQIAEEQKLLSSHNASTGNVIQSYIRASTNSSESLTTDEMLGNIFILNFAGHDTTAITLGYGLALLAAYPEVQDWIHKEIQYYSREAQTYEKIYKKLKRTNAVLLETLRLYDPIPGVPKWIDRNSTAQLEIRGKTYTIPPETLIIPNMQASQTHPRYWGNNSLEWHPQRWITPGVAPTLEEEQLFEPQKGTYFPWSDGMRNCPGKKFAQVEWVAILSTLFKDYYVEPVPRPRESMEKARQRTLNTVKDSNLKLLMSMRKPREVVVRWRRQ